MFNLISSNLQNRTCLHWGDWLHLLCLNYTPTDNYYFGCLYNCLINHTHKIISYGLTSLLHTVSPNQLQKCTIEIKIEFFLITVNLYGSKWSNFVTACKYYFNATISYDRHLRVFVDMLLNTPVLSSVSSERIHRDHYHFYFNKDHVAWNLFTRWRNWKTRKPISTFSAAYFTGFIPYTSTHNKNPLYHTTLHIHGGGEYIYIYNK